VEEGPYRSLRAAHHPRHALGGQVVAVVEDDRLGLAAGEATHRRPEHLVAGARLVRTTVVAAVARPQPYSLSKRAVKAPTVRLCLPTSLTVVPAVAACDAAMPYTRATPLPGLDARGGQVAAAAAGSGWMWANMLRPFHVGKARTSQDGPSSRIRASRVASAQDSCPACHFTNASASAVT